MIAIDQIILFVFILTLFLKLAGADPRIVINPILNLCMQMLLGIAQLFLSALIHLLKFGASTLNAIRDRAAAKQAAKNIDVVDVTDEQS